ncbi:hypothetical protein LX36DRAFT_730988 [Colletotrichum falcatum]|nr:hypothetical protein LX36DRAFT_730988 [Colletotrichum falcatum]
MFWLTGAADPSLGIPSLWRELVEEAILLITSGSDTTSIGTCSTMYYLLHNPDKLARLRTEARRLFTRVNQIDFGMELQTCTCLRACVNEGMRLSLAAGLVLPP